jgi:hypothetical protein
MQNGWTHDATTMYPVPPVGGAVQANPAPWYFAPGTWYGVMTGVIVFAVTALSLWMWWRWPAQERAFNWLSVRLLLGPRSQALLRRLSFFHGQAEPVALLLSKHAFDQAVSAARATGANLDHGALRWVERRAFS